MGFADLLRRVRTDLDVFSPIESELLQYHGYWATHVRNGHLLPEVAVAAPRWTAYAGLDDTADVTLRAELSGSDAFRLTRRRRAS